MQHRPGTFIVIEGTDGSGKGTQFDLLCERLRQAGYDVAAFDFPQYDAPSSYFVKQYLNGEYGNASEVGPYTASLFYALDRYEAAPKIRQALEQGKIVVSNRFTGSSMGHQGTKFRSPEERRGYFIWLDNLEFEMLRIPRPDISFVLRVPAEIAQSLVDKKAPRAYTNQKRDIHEADLGHLQKSVEVYDDLTQLFPKDFQRIDCVRNDSLLDVSTIQNMLWEKITPLLPPPPQLEMPMKITSDPTVSSPAAGLELPATEDEPATDTDNQAVPQMQLTIDNASDLLTQRLEQAWSDNYPEQPAGLIRYDQKDPNGNYKYYVPIEFDALTTQHYHTYMDQIFERYAEMLYKLTTYISENATVPHDQRDNAWKYRVQLQAHEAMRPVLPIAATSNLTIPIHNGMLEELIIRLLIDELPETRKAGERLLGKIRTEAPNLLRSAGFTERASAVITYRATVYAKLKKLVREYLPDNHAAETTPVQLTDSSPRNEMDLLPDMVYEYSSLPLKTLREEIINWPYSRKLEIFETYIGQRTKYRERPGAALKKAHYTWDLVTSYAEFRELQRHCPTGAITSQVLTPRYGYDIPKLIEDAGLADQFELCFDTSLRLYSLLQQAGYEREAQYATLQGHKMRWNLNHTADDAFQLLELSTKPTTYTASQQMREKLAEVHPLLAESIQRATPDKTAAPASSATRATP
jgi:dTMP kinase